MGWTLTNCTYTFNGQPTQAHGIGNNVAWKCNKCDYPVLFMYRGQGGHQGNKAKCQGCKAEYYLTPEFDINKEPKATRPPAPVMDIRV